MVVSYWREAELRAMEQVIAEDFLKARNEI